MYCISFYSLIHGIWTMILLHFSEFFFHFSDWLVISIIIVLTCFLYQCVKAFKDVLERQMVKENNWLENHSVHSSASHAPFPNEQTHLVDPSTRNYSDIPWTSSAPVPWPLSYKLVIGKRKLWLKRAVEKTVY